MGTFSTIALLLGALILICPETTQGSNSETSFSSNANPFAELRQNGRKCARTSKRCRKIGGTCVEAGSCSVPDIPHGKCSKDGSCTCCPRDLSAICKPKKTCKENGGFCVVNRKACRTTGGNATLIKGGCNCKKSWNRRGSCCVPTCKSYGGFMVGGQCLIFSSDLLAWSDAKDSCSDQGLQLASLKNATAFNEYMSLDGDYYTNNGLTGDIWLGATKLSDTWTWTNGSPVEDGFPWAEDEPSTDYDCLKWYYVGSGKFAVHDCHINLFYICEKVGLTLG